jgi:hypothetical protein
MEVGARHANQLGEIPSNPLAVLLCLQLENVDYWLLHEDEVSR